MPYTKTEHPSNCGPEKRPEGPIVRPISPDDNCRQPPSPHERLCRVPAESTASLGVWPSSPQGPSQPRPTPGEPEGPGSSLGPYPSDARSPRPRGSHRLGHAAIPQRLLPCQRCACMAAASPTPPAPSLQGRAHRGVPARPSRTPRKWRRAWHDGKNGIHLKAKAGPSGLLRPKAAGLSKNTLPSPARDGRPTRGRARRPG